MRPRPRHDVAASPRRTVAGALLAGCLVLQACALGTVDLEAARPLALRTTINATDGKTLARLFRQNRAPFAIDDVPEHVIDAVLAAEDARFFEHDGYDLRAIARAAIVNWQEGRVVQGGSTITQQYIKNTYFRRAPRTLTRKARELRLAMEIEKQYSKEKILELYLNTVYFGDGAYGLKAAAETYFDTKLHDLTPAQGALLAALIRAPSRYDPREHQRRAQERRDYVLDRMAELGWITPQRALRAQHRPLGVSDERPQPRTREPYFVEAVKREMLTDERFGATDVERARALFDGGLRIETTLDLDLQRMARDAIESVLGDKGDPSVALVSIVPETGEIVAMVAGNDWETSQVNLALGRKGGGSGRQPGSAFKPIVAATALEQGILLDTFVETGPVRFTFDDGTVWAPAIGSANASEMSIADALRVSSNGVFARLGIELGANRIASQAHLMGVGSRLPDVPSLALGSAEVSVLDMAAAFATIANHGRAVEPTTIRNIRTPNGQDLGPQQEVVDQALSPGNAYMLTKALEGVIASGTGTAADIGRPAAGKTGTTNDYADAWFVGYTPQLVTAVWVGYPDGRIPMTSVRGITVLGGTFPARIWRAFMLQAMRDEPVEDFELPKSALVKVEIDPETGLLALPWCPGEMVKMLRELVPQEYCPNPYYQAPPPIYTITTPPPSQTGGKKSDRGSDGKDDGSGKNDGGRDGDGSGGGDGGGGGDPDPEPTPKPEPTPSPSG